MDGDKAAAITGTRLPRAAHRVRNLRGLSLSLISLQKDAGVGLVRRQEAAACDNTYEDETHLRGVITSFTNPDLPLSQRMDSCLEALMADDKKLATAMKTRTMRRILDGEMPVSSKTMKHASLLLWHDVRKVQQQEVFVDRSGMQIGGQFQLAAASPSASDHAAGRDAFVKKLLPPEHLRVIDCKRSVNECAVMLMDWDVKAPAELGGGYTAISHTYGMEVYEVFDCACAATSTLCLHGRVPRANPNKTPCKGHAEDEDPHLHQRIITDILNMCRLLLQAGALYAWHDGVCIAQYDDLDVSYFIQHIGWIYATAKETVIFLHSVGHPMAPIACAPARHHTSRWQTRVWTYQEAVLSKCRRYCVRLGLPRHGASCGSDRPALESLSNCCNWIEFELKLASWYEASADSNITIIEEERFRELVTEMSEIIWKLELKDGRNAKSETWYKCLQSWSLLLKSYCFSFPTVAHALENCSQRESKHEGDRMNSILALSSVESKFNAHKDKYLEENTKQFFEKMEKNGLALAVFTTNQTTPPSNANNVFHKHTWLPSLSGRLIMSPSHFQKGGPNFHTNQIKFEVLKNGNIELQGPLACVSMQFNVVLHEQEIRDASKCGFQLGEHDPLSVILCAETLGPFYIASLVGAIPQVYLGNVLLPDLAYDTYELRVLLAQLFRGTKRWQDVMGFYNSDNDDMKNLYMRRLYSLPTVQDWSKRGEVKFCASLIFPAKVLDLDWECLFPAILVQGDINSHVAKIGCFHGSKELHDILKQRDAHVTFPKKLVIR